jgi:2-polyprenyl-6-methoxyphenol hydroxylase-like FAD-dependent oxidoreductase
MMLGLLLARKGIDVVVLEKHEDFLRDFRGDTIHPSTLEVVHELGLLSDFLNRPHQKMPQLRGWVGSTQLTVADFSHLPVQCKFIAFMPQWDFLDFLADEARRYPNFELKMEAAVTDVIEEGGRICGVRATGPERELEVRADLVVAADGRASILRQRAGLEIIDRGAPIDVLWMHMSRKTSDPAQSFGRFDQGKVLAMLNRESYWQCGYVIPKGGIELLKRQPLETLRAGIAEIAPFLADRVQELKTWDDLKLLTVRIDYLRQWYKEGLLCIGDAAHAMSPVGGVGINLAIQDAVAAANLLAETLRRGRPTVSDLRKVQQRRLWPTRMTQRVQLIMQDFVLGSALSSGGFKTLPLPLRLLQRFPILTRVPGRLIGMGFRPEHVL